MIFTEERNLDKILVQCRVVKSINEVRRNKTRVNRAINNIRLFKD